MAPTTRSPRRARPATRRPPKEPGPAACTVAVPDQPPELTPAATLVLLDILHDAVGDHHGDPCFACGVEVDPDHG